MKKIGLILLMIVAMAFTSQAQGLYGHGGYSWSKGMFGGEYKSGYWGLGLGYMPTKMPMSGNPVSSISAFVSFYTVEEGDIDTGWYLMLATASAGYRMETSYGESRIEPMTILTVGYIWDIDGVYLKGGGGYGFFEGGNTPTFEIVLGIRLF